MSDIIRYDHIPEELEVEGSLRASREDRDKIIERLHQAYSDGRLAEEPYNARIAMVDQVTTIRGLESMLSDLPAAPGFKKPRNRRSTRQVIEDWSDNHGWWVAIWAFLSAAACVAGSSVIGTVTIHPHQPVGVTAVGITGMVMFIALAILGFIIAIVHVFKELD